jgi:hypothetical protein
LLGKTYPSRRIFIGSHSLPPSLVASSVLQRLKIVANVLSLLDTVHTPEDAVGLGDMHVRSGPSFALIDDVRRATAQVANVQDMLRYLGASELHAF